ncbi:MAG: YwaF family protein [Bacilli bacterium]|nr:YwaF family protein [Bacilli bacterium]
MNLLENFMLFLDSKMTTPTSYGIFHIIFLLIVITVTFLLCKYFKDCNESTFKRIIFITWIIIFILEVYKQVIFSFNYDNQSITWDYQWYAFPFQLCSTPIYILPIIFLSKDGKIHQSAIAYTATFALFGGIAVMIYPGDVFIETIGINLQTMIHHGSQVVMGIFCLIHERKRLNFKYYTKGILVFLILLTIAVTSNIIVYNIFQKLSIDETFNMFYVGPYFPSTLPILSSIYPKVPYIVFLLLYTIGFVLISYIIFFVFTKINNIFKKNYTVTYKTI